MTMIYRCDVCHENTEPGDCYGIGVFSNDPEGRGRAKVWHESSDVERERSGVSVTPFKEGSDQQVCGKCLGELLWEMVLELWGDDPAYYIKDKVLRLTQTWVQRADESVAAMGEKALDISREHVEHIAHHYRAEPVVPNLGDWLEEKANGDTSGGDREDSDVPGVRAVEPVPEPSTLVGADDSPCPSCSYLGRFKPAPNCTRPEFHSVGRGPGEG